ncbi:MAG: tripartite tricarboxylate transporter substrate binding protein [Proteobacteria bacterium]|nr:tripartite tricarboxylate transporter substrate binding protein [Pseudomonadota bacterium]
MPSAAGTGSDIVLRGIADRLTTTFKQPFTVDNRPGGSGLIASRALMSAPPDGYTILYSNASATVMLQALRPDLGIDFAKDMVPVSLTVVGGVFLLVNPQVPAKNLNELIALVKANPAKYSTYGSWGIGSNGHFTMEWLKKQTGMQIEHVPYKTIPTLLTELATGVLSIAWCDSITPVPFIQAGKVRAIAVTGPLHMPQVPDVATMGEQGYPFDLVGWQGFFLPVGTPQPIVSRLNEEVMRTMSTPELKQMLNRMNASSSQLRTPEEFRGMMLRDVGGWRRIARDSNIQAVD